jgi:hypothetical protein
MDNDGREDDMQPRPLAEPADEPPDSGMRSAHARLSRKRTKTGCLSEFARS